MSSFIMRMSTSIIRPALQLVKPDQPDWLSFVYLTLEQGKDHCTKGPYEAEFKLKERESELIARIDKSAFFLYGSPRGIVGGADAVIDKQTLLIEQFIIKVRLGHLGFEDGLANDLQLWAKGKGIKQILVPERPSLLNVFKASREELDGKVIYRKELV